MLIANVHRGWWRHVTSLTPTEIAARLFFLRDSLKVMKLYWKAMQFLRLTQTCDDFHDHFLTRDLDASHIV